MREAKAKDFSLFVSKTKYLTWGENTLPPEYSTKPYLPARLRQVRLYSFVLILDSADDWYSTAPRKCRPTATAPSIEERIPFSPTIRQTAACSLPILKFKWNHKPYKAISHHKYTKNQRDMKIFRQLFPGKAVDWQTIAHCASISRQLHTHSLGDTGKSVYFSKIQGYQVQIPLVSQVWWMTIKVMSRPSYPRSTIALLHHAEISQLISNLKNESQCILFPPVVGQADNVSDNSQMDESAELFIWNKSNTHLIFRNSMQSKNIIYIY